MKIEWNGGRLSRKRAALLMWKMYAWLAETLTQEQWDSSSKDVDYFLRKWPKWKWNGGTVEEMERDNPACEEVSKNYPLNGNALDCEKCILVDLYGGSVGGCQRSPQSPEHRIHQVSNVEDVRLRLSVVANAAENVYKKKGES